MQIVDIDNFSTEFRTARGENKHDVPDCATILHKKGHLIKGLNKPIMNLMKVEG